MLTPTSCPGSIPVLCHQCPGNHRRSPSPMESPNLQSAPASEGLPDHCQHHGLPSKKLALLSCPAPPYSWHRRGDQYSERSPDRVAISFLIYCGHLSAVLHQSLGALESLGWQMCREWAISEVQIYFYPDVHLLAQHSCCPQCKGQVIKPGAELVFLNRKWAPNSHHKNS